MADDPRYSRRVEGPTPNGGAYAVAYFGDDDGGRATEAEATRVEVVEFDADGEAIHRTYASITPAGEDDEP